MSTLNRIGSVNLLNDTMRDVSNVQEQLAKLQTQISSGVKAQNFQELNGQVEQYTGLESLLRRTDQFTDSNSTLVSSLQTADNAMSQMEDLADNMKTMLMQQLNASTGSTTPFGQEMQDALNSFATLLNTNYNGRYIFAGTATDTQPVPDTSVKPATSGVPDAGYYAGSNNNLQMRIDDGVTMQYPVRADDPAFQKIYAAAQQAIDAFNKGDTDAMGKALDLLVSGQTDLTSARSRVNAATVNVSDTNDRLGTLKLYWQGVTEQVGKTDIVAASSQVASYEAVLQATFQVYARLSQLKLSDYLG